MKSQLLGGVVRTDFRLMENIHSLERLTGKMRGRKMMGFIFAGRQCGINGFLMMIRKTVLPLRGDRHLVGPHRLTREPSPITDTAPRAEIMDKWCLLSPSTKSLAQINVLKD